MATKKVTSAAKTATFAGKYKGPDEFKGDATLISAWKASGSPKDHAGWLKTYNKKPAAAAPGAPAPAGEAPTMAPPAPVANADGSLVDPNQWQADQARLAAAEADNDAMAAIEGEEVDANMTEQAEGVQYKQQRDIQALAAKRQRDEYAKVKPVQKAKVGTTLSYRGMGRGSAAKRQFKKVADEQATTDNLINENETKASTEYTANIGAAAQRRAAKLASLAPKKLALAARGARSGVYTK